MAFVLRGLVRGVPSLRPACLGTTRWQAADDKCYSSEGSKVSDEPGDKTVQKEKAKQKREKAKMKLNSLLESIEKQQSTVAAPIGERGGSSSSRDLSSRLARPGARPRPKQVVPNKKNAPAAAAAAPAAPVRQPTLDEQVAAAAREVASSLSGDPAQTERDLLSKLSEDQDQPSAGQAEFSELMSSMKVEQRPAARPGRAEHIRHQVGGQRADSLRQARRDRPPFAPRTPRTGGGAALDEVDLNSGDVLGIFTDMKPLDAAAEVALGSAPSQWERIHARELRLSVAHPPANAWEEMAVWTEQGKLWHLPINNEQGREDEAAVGFHEHVFLERHLEPWCPPRGPVRQFMELVCVALGKNPWLSIQEKHEHIDWFREYFAGKQKLLQELRAV